MSSAEPRDVNGHHRRNRANGVPVPPGVTSQDELEQAAADGLHPDLTDVEAVLRTVAELTAMPLAPADHNGQTARSFLRRQPVRIVAGSIEDGYTDVFEVICCDCGDDPYLDYSDVSARLQRLRGPYPLRAGLATYQEHLDEDYLTARAR
jgi:hypothetical protein